MRLFWRMGHLQPGIIRKLMISILQSLLKRLGKSSIKEALFVDGQKELWDCEFSACYSVGVMTAIVLYAHGTQAYMMLWPDVFYKTFEYAGSILLKLNRTLLCWRLNY